MGGVVTKTADGIGGVIGNIIAAPFKKILGASCDEVCSGPWDVMCFIEHLCISNLVKLLMILVLCFIILMFFYLLFKVGVCQCIVKSLCKICWGVFVTYWSAIGHIICFLWHKLTNTKRVYRGHNQRRYRDVEVGYSSSVDEYDDYRGDHRGTSRKRRRNWKSNRSRHRVKLKSRRVSVRMNGPSREVRNSRRRRSIKVRYPKSKIKISKRRYK